MDLEEIAGLSPGIRGAVLAINSLRDFVTTDSGDGSNRTEGMECGWDMPMVVAEVPLEEMCERAEFLQEILVECGLDSNVEASYSPGGPAVVVAYGIDLVALGYSVDRGIHRKSVMEMVGRERPRSVLP